MSHPRLHGFLFSGEVLILLTILCGSFFLFQPLYEGPGRAELSPTRSVLMGSSSPGWRCFQGMVPPGFISQHRVLASWENLGMGGCIHPDCPEHPLCSLRCLAAEDPLSLQSMKEFQQCWMLALREFTAMERIPPMELGWISWKGFLCPQPSPSHGCSQPSHSSSLRTCSPIFPQSHNPRAWKSPPGSSSPTFDQPPPCHQP